jgi:hypothetical protein
MAKVVGTVTMPWNLEKQDEIMSKMKEKSAKVDLRGRSLSGLVFRTPMADSYAWYVVVDAISNPVKLKHIPYMDAWTADPIWLRGLTREDIIGLVQRERNLEALFGEK